MAAPPSWRSLWTVLLVAVFVLPSSEWARALGKARAEAAEDNKDKVCSPTSTEVADRVGQDIRRLHNDLLCDYDRLVVKPGTDVNVNMYVYRLHLDVHRGFLQMLVGLDWEWHDPRLRWDPAVYSDVDEVSMTEKEIWVPDLEMMSAMQRQFDILRCTVSFHGQVSCRPVYNLETTCGHSARHWPVDVHECVFEMASRNHDGREYYISIGEKIQEMDVSSMVSNEWEVVNATQSLRNTTISESFHFSRLEVRLVLRRNKYVHIMTLGVPVVVLPCLILAQLWVDPRWPGRILLGCSSVAALCMYLQYLSYTVPDDTEGNAPLIVLFYRDSLVVAVFVIILTVVLRGVSECPGAPPPWLTSSSSWVLRRVPRAISAGMLLEEDDEDEDDAATVDLAEEASAPEGKDAVGKPVSWRRIARLVDRVAFVVLVVVFGVMAFAERP